jgi:hypothetical protein
MDKLEQIAWNCADAIAIVGCPETGKFKFIVLREASRIPATAAVRMNRAGFRFLGLFGFDADSKPRSAFTEPLTAEFIDALVSEFLAHAERGAQMSETDGTEADPLERMYRLIDPREEN